MQESTTARRPTTARPIRWHRGALGAAQREARGRGAQLLIYFFASGQAESRRVYSDVIEAAPRGALRSVVCVSANVKESRGLALARRFAVTRIPTILLVTPDLQSVQTLPAKLSLLAAALAKDRAERPRGTPLARPVSTQSVSAGREDTSDSTDTRRIRPIPRTLR